MARGEMVYNSQKEDVEIPEYGRNVQNMVRYLKDIEDKALKQLYAEEIINLFAIMYPANRHLADYKEKLWNHLYRIAKYDLDLEIPEGITIHSDSKLMMEAHLPYPQRQFNNRHYGRYIQDLIKNALLLEEGPKRDGFAEVIASYMKLAYRTWNKEHFVSDDIIIQDLREMSHSGLNFDDNYSIENLVSMKNKLGSNNTPVTSNWRSYGPKGGNKMKKNMPLNKPLNKNKFKKRIK
ncbi:MAG: DUF4290 domain-containing protein [Saprospiraceae bacterium]|nr:DUF4290 domain-containing protein [Saprospiraceae bacterium]